MRRRLVTAVLSVALFGGEAAAQILDDTLVPRGQLRLQAHPTFGSWDARFGRAADGTEGRERLGIDLSDPTGLSLFPGSATLIGHVEDITGTPGYAPSLGPADARVTQDVTRIEFGGQLGVFDWLTIGVVVPWIQTRTAIDLTLEPDTVGGGDLGLSPTLTDAAGVDGYLLSLGSAATAAMAGATAACAGGPGAACSAAQMLADRASGLLGSSRGAYGASPFFPMAGSVAAVSLGAVSSTLDADLIAAGLTPIGAAMVFASDAVTADDLLALPATGGAGFDGAPLGTRRGLWQTGDVEASVLVRLLEGGRAAAAGTSSGLSYRLTAGFLVRLATGTPEDADIFLDLGTGDGQPDLEGRVIGTISSGRLGLAAGAKYGVQESTTLTKRVALPEIAVPGLATRQEVRFSPASYLHVEVVPSLTVTDALSLTGQLRYFKKGRDVYELIDPSLPLNPLDLSVESGVKLMQIGGGLRYSTVESWRAGAAPSPLDLHLRLVFSTAGSGGQVPVSTRVEAGIRLFKRFWGPEPAR